MNSLGGWMDLKREEYRFQNYIYLIFIKQNMYSIVLCVYENYNFITTRIS